MGYTYLLGVLKVFFSFFSFFFFLREGLQPGGHFLLFTGKWAYNRGAYKLGGGGGLKAVVVYGSLCQTFGYWGRCKENKTKKKPSFFNALLLTI